MSTVAKSTERFSGFLPNTIPGCVVWLDGADSSRITLSGSAVTSVVDKAQNITFTTQGTSSLLTLVNQINGRQTLYFNNNTSGTVLLRGALANLTVGSFFVAWQPVAQQSDGYRALFCPTYPSGPQSFPVFGYIQNGNTVAPYTTWVGPGTPTTVANPGTNYITFYSWSGTTTSVAFNGETPRAGTQGAYTATSASLDIMHETASKTSGYVG
jgi:hypothetical protein